MDLSLFQYKYPKELIAQHPLPERDASKMMVLHRDQKGWEHQSVQSLPKYLEEGDVLVLNDTKVFPARLLGTDGKNRNVEILLLEPINGNGTWRSLAKPFKKISVGSEIHFAPGLKGTITNKTADDLQIQFQADNFETQLEQAGLPPLPPYIKRKATMKDKDRYQSLFARHTGSAAAPTASLHFSEKLLSAIKAKGIQIAYVTLHVSTDTFLPIREENVTKHKMHGERFHVSQETITMTKKAKTQGRRIVAVGTTAVRALESDWTKPTTHLFIYPGYHFKIVDGLLTNFHQPASTLLLLVASLAEREFLLQSYEEAIRQAYRLFSYGDCMLIL